MEPLAQPQGGKKRTGRAAGFGRHLLAFHALLLVALALTPFFCRGACAAGYSFEVPNERVLVRINADSSIDVWYAIEFKNDPSGAPIEVVDIGMPATNYLMDQCSAAVNGSPLSDIRVSTVVSPGVEVHLNEKAIQPGQSGTLEFHGKDPQMVFSDTQHSGYASVEFKNTWWDKASVHGDTSITVSIQFPPGVKPNETVYHREKPASVTTAEGSVVFTWVKAGARPSEGYTYGVSFPAVYVGGTLPYKPQLPDYTPRDSQHGGYHGFSNSSTWMYLRIGLPIVVILIAAIARGFVSFGRVRKGGVKVDYVKPSMGIEGAGPMKQLMPAEAAVLLSQDLDRVAAIAYFELLQKGLITVRSKKPLVLSRGVAVPEGGPQYHGLFLGAVRREGDLDREGLKLAVTSLIKDVGKRVMGFSHAETAKYYEDAVKRAWVEVKSAADHRERVDLFNRSLPLLLLDTGFASKVREAFGAGDFPMPSWAVSLSDTVGGAPVPVTASAGELLVPGSSFADMLAGGFMALQDAAFVHVQDFQQEIVKEVNPDEYRRVYHPYYGTRGSLGGGGGCACACACAGCACACAGGGR